MRMNDARETKGFRCFLWGENERPAGHGGTASRLRGRSLKFFIQAGSGIIPSTRSWARALNRILRDALGCFCQMTRRWIIHLARIHSDDAAGRKIVIPQLPIKPALRPLFSIPPKFILAYCVPVSWVTYSSTTYQRIVQVSRNVAEIFVFYVITVWTHENECKVRISCELWNEEVANVLEAYSSQYTFSLD